MTDLREPSEEMVAAGVSQIAFVVVTLTLVKFDLAPATPEFVVAAWVTSAVCATVTYFLASSWLTLPMIAASGLWLLGMLVTGEVTVAQLVAAFETASSSSPTASPFAFDPVEFGRSMFRFGVLVPTCLGVTALIKTILKVIAAFREVGR